MVFEDDSVWTDLVSGMDPRLSYVDIDEAVDALRYATENRDFWSLKCSLCLMRSSKEPFSVLLKLGGLYNK